MSVTAMHGREGGRVQQPLTQAALKVLILRDRKINDFQRQRFAMTAVFVESQLSSVSVTQ